MAPDGVRLSYQLEGSGPPLLLHMGGACDSGLWRAAGYLPRLANSHTCILLDHRGHGDSDHPAGADANHIDRYVADVCALLDALGIEGTAFWGYSSGAVVGLNVSGEHPSRIRCLVMSGAIWNASPIELADVIASRTAEHREHGWEQLIAGIEEEEGEMPDWMKARIRATDIEPFIGWWEARAKWDWNPWDALPHLDGPGLIVVGELEDPDDDMAGAAGLMKRGRRIRVPGAGHIGCFLDSAFVLPRVEAFLAAST
jgi:pimeloyl-ACP methyl ester carboxylesterase